MRSCGAARGSQRLVFVAVSGLVAGQGRRVPFGRKSLGGMRPASQRTSSAAVDAMAAINTCHVRDARSPATGEGVVVVRVTSHSGARCAFTGSARACAAMLAGASAVRPLAQLASLASLRHTPAQLLFLKARVRTCWETHSQTDPSEHQKPPEESREIRHRLAACCVARREVRGHASRSRCRSGSRADGLRAPRHRCSSACVAMCRRRASLFACVRAWGA